MGKNWILSLLRLKGTDFLEDLTVTFHPCELTFAVHVIFWYEYVLTFACELTLLGAIHIIDLYDTGKCTHFETPSFAPPLSGLGGFREGRIPGCYVTRFVPH